MSRMILFESHDNDFTECLLWVVGWLAMRGFGTDERLLRWLKTNDAVDTLSEAFAAAVYARDCSDVAMDIDRNANRFIDHVTLEDRRKYLGKVKISVVDALDPDGYNGEAVVWDGDDLRIV